MPKKKVKNILEIPTFSGPIFNVFLINGPNSRQLKEETRLWTRPLTRAFGIPEESAKKAIKAFSDGDNKVALGVVGPKEKLEKMVDTLPPFFRQAVRLEKI